jgi:hypothetical protein
MKRKHKPGWSRAGLTAFAGPATRSQCADSSRHCSVDYLPPMFRDSLADRVLALSDLMHSVAVELEYFGGFDPLALPRAEELHGAADIATEWATEIRNAFGG